MKSFLQIKENIKPQGYNFSIDNNNRMYVLCIHIHRIGWFFE